MAKEENKQINELILSKLESIESQTIQTNGRVTSLEKELLNAKNDIAQALTIISGHSTIISYYKQESDKAKDKLIEEQSKKIEKDALEREKFNKRMLYTLGLAVLFILGTLGLVNKDFIKFLLWD